MMKTTMIAAGLCALLMAAAFNAYGAATNRYVVAPGTEIGTPTSPYASWGTAGTNIMEVVLLAYAYDEGDLLIISNGTYWLTNELSLGNMVLTNASGDRTKVIINGNFPTYTNRCFYVHNGSAGLESLTITNGAVTNDNGGGIRFTAGYIRNCVIAGNRCWSPAGSYNGGGGIHMSTTAGTVSDCDIYGNFVYVASTDALSGGGGACVRGGQIIRSRLAFNVSSNNPTVSADMCGSGGGAFITENGAVYKCDIVSNTAYGAKWGGYGGGGVYLYAGGFLSNSVITYNYGPNSAGGVGTWYGGRTYNCVIAYNQGSQVGGMQLSTSEKIDSCTISSNKPYGLRIVTSWGAGISNVVNSIIYWNQSGDITYTDGKAYTSLVACCVAPGYTAFLNPGGTTNDPLLVSLVSGNLQLSSAQSSCYNHGVNLNWMTNAVDAAGNRRIDRVNNRVDIGAYEFQPTITIFEVK